MYAHLDGANTNYTTKSPLDGAFLVSGLAPGFVQAERDYRGNRVTVVDAQAGASVCVSRCPPRPCPATWWIRPRASPRRARRVRGASYLNEPSKQYVAWHAPARRASLRCPSAKAPSTGGNLAVAVRADGYAPVEQMLALSDRTSRVADRMSRRTRGGHGAPLFGPADCRSVHIPDRYDQHRSPETRNDSEAGSDQPPDGQHQTRRGPPAYSSAGDRHAARGTTSSVTISSRGRLRGKRSSPPASSPRQVGVHLYV